MNASFARFIDWLAIQIVSVTVPVDAPDPKLNEALQFLKSPEFISIESESAQVELTGPLDFRFPTPRRSALAENNFARGQLFRCGERWQERPTVILLHGSGDSLNYKYMFPRVARLCNWAGFNAATLMAPLNMERRPRQFGGARSYSTALQFAQATAQAVAENRALTGWLLAQGCPAVALWGYSMGAWYAGMAVCQDPRLSAVALGAPCARLRPWLTQHALRPRLHRKFARVRENLNALNQTTMNLTTTQPVIPAKNILLVEGIYDLLCPKEDIEDLWQSWGQPDIWRLKHGHCVVCCGMVPGLSRRIVGWLAPRLEACQKTNA